jgi:outer membrane receptor protein involved in Fe transport
LDTLPENGIISKLYNHVPAYVYHDFQVRYALPTKSRLEAYIGVNNAFNKQPPFLPQGMASTTPGTETDPVDYDPFGRFVYGGISAKF